MERGNPRSDSWNPRAFTPGKLSTPISELEGIDDESIIETLTQVKGVGRWTAQMLLIFRLHRWDVLPVDDLGIRAGIRRVYELTELPNKKTVESLGERWKPYRTIASWYLWRSLEIGSNLTNNVDRS